MLDPGGDLDWRAMESCRDAYAFFLLFCVCGGGGVLDEYYLCFLIRVRKLV